MRPALSQTEFQSVPLCGLEGPDPLVFSLYLGTGDGVVLYRDSRTELTEEHLSRLRAEGVERLFIRPEHRLLYYRRVEQRVDTILNDRAQPLDLRVDVLHGVAMEMAEDLMNAPPERQDVRRARRVMANTAGFMLGEEGGFDAIRTVLDMGGELAAHSLTVGFLSMGLAREVLGTDPDVLLNAGLAGLLHDIGRVGQDAQAPDPEHTIRGHRLLVELGLPEEVCDAALFHHERWDGSGHPRGLLGEELPEMARIVGLVDTFQRVYAAQPARVTVYDAMRSMAQACRGGFDARLAMCFVKLFAPGFKRRGG